MNDVWENSASVQTGLDSLWGAVITGHHFDLNRHRLRIEMEARYSDKEAVHHALTLTGIASLTLVDHAVESGTEFHVAAWDYAELTSISAIWGPHPSGTFWTVRLEVWSTRIEVLCTDLAIL